jgi:O-antigen/teichoic acid export membrane protein
MRLLYQKATKYTALIMFPILIIAYVHAEDVIRIWMGDGFAVSVGLSKLFIVSLFFVSIVSSGTEMMIGLNRIRELILVAGIASIVNLLVSIILVRNIGVAGVVVGTVVGSIITAIGYLHRINKAFDVSMTDFWKSVLLRPVLVLLPLLLIYAAIGNLIIADILFIIASPFLLFVMVDKDDRHAFLGLLQARK